MANLNVETALARNNEDLVQELCHSFDAESPEPLPRFSGRSLLSTSKRSKKNDVVDDEEYNKTVSEEAPSTGGRNRLRMAAKESILASAKSLINYNRETVLGSALRPLPSDSVHGSISNTIASKFKRKKDFSNE